MASNLFYHLLLLLLASFFFFSSFNAVSSQKTLYVGTLQGMSCGYTHEQGDLWLATRDINSVGPVGATGYNWRGIFKNAFNSTYQFGSIVGDICGRDSQPIIQKTLALLNSSEIKNQIATEGLPPIFIGPNNFVEAAYAVGGSEAVFLGPLGNSGAYSDKTLYPYYARTDPVLAQEAQVIIQLCQQMKWNAINIIWDQQYAEIQVKVTALAFAAGIKIGASQSYVGSPQNVGQGSTPDLNIGPQLSIVKQSGVYVNVLLFVSSDSAALTNLMRAYGMAGAGSRYTNIATSAWTRVTAAFQYNTDKAVQTMFGGFGILIVNQLDNTWKEFKAKWTAEQAANPSKFVGYNAAGVAQPSVKNAPVIAAQVYDAYLLAAQAYVQFIQDRDYCAVNPTVQKCITRASQTAQQYLYNILLNQTCLGGSGALSFLPNGDRTPSYHIVNGAITPGADYNYIGSWTNSDHLVLDPSATIIFGSGTSEVPLAMDRGILSGDLLEQSYSASAGVLSYIAAVIGSWTSLLLIEAGIHTQKQTKVTTKGVQPLFYILGASLSYSICGIWASLFIAANGKDFQDGIVSLLYYSYVVVPAVLIPVTTTALSYILMANNLKRTNREKVLETQLGPKQGKKKKETLCSIISQNVIYVCKGFNILSFISAIILFAGLLLLYLVLATSGRSIQSTITYSASFLIAACLVGFPLCWLGLCCFFHLVRFREIGAFIMGLAIVLSWELAFMSEEYYYNTSIQLLNSGSDIWSSYSLTLITSIIAAITCFIFLALQFARMKLSRNSLDLLVKKIQGEMNKLESELQMKKETYELLMQEYEFREHLLEMINIIRPLHNKSGLIYSMMKHLKYKKQTQQLNSTNDKKSASKNSDSNPAIMGKITNINQMNKDNHSTDSNPVANKYKEHSVEESGSVYTATGIPGQIQNPPGAESLAALTSGNKYLEQVLENLPALDGPVPEYLLRSINLNDILLNPVTAEIFKDCVAQDHVQENAAFWLEVERYRSMAEKKDRIVIADLICQDYIVDGAPHQIKPFTENNNNNNKKKPKPNYAFTSREYEFTTALENLCTLQTFTRFQFSPPTMIRACNQFLSKAEESLEHYFLPFQLSEKEIREKICVKELKQCRKIWTEEEFDEKREKTEEEMKGEMEKRKKKRKKEEKKKRKKEQKKHMKELKKEEEKAKAEQPETQANSQKAEL